MNEAISTFRLREPDEFTLRTRAPGTANDAIAIIQEYRGRGQPTDGELVAWLDILCRVAAYHQRQANLGVNHE